MITEQQALEIVRSRFMTSEINYGLPDDAKPTPSTFILESDELLAAFREVERITADNLLNLLHESIGVCTHCGKKKCAGKLSGSKLPANIPTDMLISTIHAMLPAPNKEVKDE